MQEKKEENVVLVGKKPVMNYVLAVITQFQAGANEVEIRARGRAISKAVDVAEVTRSRFLQQVKIADIKIGTEERPSQTGEKINVSTISIKLKK
ncbi:MAG: DNA-binding protein Alba [Candidatus Nanoarchaeia archaeon]|nr:DNA-binding protein Alba [Candidatus Haiyanarchaeum thermophilum]MCW1303273.1 DNA-binding protein Alba [Candidatus Haiyanarchaeum thermophilum]MCW1303996.1 DNA-binding protein Alba [Candidatus Haiyanarchaeum thermophilum]MCW1306432.1 DNA-binding protein Alba [Candidatus Haiyanarchaeum thermophilum]MCW1307270.1 DNA-binding protein Alba [Candidatus Haiyanarchaeum thermophilum]